LKDDMILANTVCITMLEDINNSTLN